MSWQKRSATTFLAVTVLSLARMSHAADGHCARETVERVARLFSSESSIATVQMQISGEDAKRNLSMKIWSRGEKVLVRISSPQDEAGTAILKVGSDIWYYLTKANRTVKMSTSTAMTSWMGSDFTIDDLLTENVLTRDYTISLSFEGKRGGVGVCEYALRPKPEAVVVWGEIVLQIRQADSVPTWRGYYDEDGKLVRELTFSEYKSLSGRIIPTRLVMRTADKADAQTTIEYEDIAFDVPISEGIFSLANLKR